MARSITYTFKGDELHSAVDKATLQGVGKACDLLVGEVKKALNKTGPNKELQKAFGNRKDSGPHSFDAGLVGIKGLSFIGMGKKNRTVAHGGTFTDSTGTDHNGMYYYGEPLLKWVQASPVGSPPHMQSRALRDSIDKQRNPAKMTGRVGPKDELVYARRQELGGPGSFPARPFLRPTLRANIARITGIITDAARKAFK